MTCFKTRFAGIALGISTITMPHMAYGADLSDALGRPVRFLAWNIGQDTVDALSKAVSPDKIDTHYVANDIFEFDVFIAAVSSDPAFITHMSSVLGTGVSDLESVAEGREFIAVTRLYPTRNKRIRIYLFDTTSFGAADIDCKVKGVTRMLLTNDVAEISGKTATDLFRCNEGNG